MPQKKVKFLKKGFYTIASRKKYYTILYYIKKALKLAWKKHHFLIPPTLWLKYWKIIIKKLHNGKQRIYYNAFNSKDYNTWLEKHRTFEKCKKFNYNPLISIVIPVYNIQKDILEECLDSILKQIYTNFEICIADDCSTNKETIETLKEYEQKDPRIKVVYRKENGHISKATNSAIEIANGEFIAFMDDDDVIPENALYEFAKVLNQNPKLDLIYTDEDKIEMDGTLCEPHFKPDYSPDTLLSCNYISHFSFFRKSIIDQIGGLRQEFFGAQDFDLVLRFVEKTNNIYHIPKVLYHWRKMPNSTAVTMSSKSYALENGKKSIEAALIRRGIKGRVYLPLEQAAHYIIEYDTPGNPMVSIIIQTKDYATILNNCLQSIYEKSKYENFEVIIVNNNSTEQETFNLLDEYKKKYNNFKVYEANYEFNYAKMMNEAVQNANGEYILLLNNDTEVLTENFIQIMLGYAMQEHIGAVGVKLLYPDGLIQHGGVLLGVQGIVNHAFLGRNRNSYGYFARLLIPYNYSAVTAACLMVKKSKYEEVHGLDEQLKVNFNDVDFNLKLLEKGYYNVFLPQVELIHYESKTRDYATTPEKRKQSLAEENYIKNKWKDKLTNDRFYNPNFSSKKMFFLDRY